MSKKLLYTILSIMFVLGIISPQLSAAQTSGSAECRTGLNANDKSPVCGINSVTYANMCALESKGVGFAHAGTCTSRVKNSGSVLFINANVFDGTSTQLQTGMNVLVKGNKIKLISRNAIQIDFKTALIDVAGKTLMPGLLDAHTHLTIIEDTPSQSIRREWTYAGAAAGRESELMLMRGFTTIRDAGGPATGLRKAIDDGRAIGPRILASGALLSMTSGHGDFSDLVEPNTTLTGNIPRITQLGYTFIVDGPDAARAAVRQNMRVGAAHIKILVDGGVVSEFDPLGVNQFSPEELRAIVEETDRWGTYVVAHAFTDSAVRHAIDAGVKVIEHGPMITEKTVLLMKEKGVWFSSQFRGGQTTPKEYGLTGEGAVKMQAMLDAAQVMIAAIKKHGLRPAFGSDFYGPEKFAIQSEEFQARLNDGFSSPEIMIQATSHNAKLFELSGKRHPYREGPLGIIKEGAYADILIVDGNPLKDASIMGDYEHNIKIIMKDGVIYKNTL